MKRPASQTRLDDCLGVPRRVPLQSDDRWALTVLRTLGFATCIGSVCCRIVRHGNSIGLEVDLPRLALAASALGRPLRRGLRSFAQQGVCFLAAELLREFWAELPLLEADEDRRREVLRRFRARSSARASSLEEIDEAPLQEFCAAVGLQHRPGQHYGWSWRPVGQRLPAHWVQQDVAHAARPGDLTFVWAVAVPGAPADCSAEVSLDLERLLGRSAQAARAVDVLRLTQHIDGRAMVLGGCPAPSY